MKIYPLLCTRSRRAISRRYWRGKIYFYRPRGDLVKRLQEELGLSINEVREEIARERRILLRRRGYTVAADEMV